MLRAVYFVPGVSVVSGIPGYASMTCWDRDRHNQLRCDEQKNGDIWLTRKDGRRLEVSALVIAWRMRDPEPAVKPEPARQVKS